MFACGEQTGLRKSQIGRSRASCLALAALVPLALGACTMAPVPHDALAAAKLALDRAETAGAAEHAPDELARAEAKLEAAHAAIGAKANEQARLLAEQAMMAARVAEAEAQAAQSQAAVDRVRVRLERQHRQLVPSGNET